MMDRREWLKRVLGAAVAAAVAPLVDLTDTTPAFWNQPAIKELMPWKITFPDGVMFSFDATVLGEKLLDDGSVEFTIQTFGPTKMSQGITFPINFAEGTSVGKVGTVPSPHAPATMVNMGDRFAEVTDIAAPEAPGAEHFGVYGTLKREPLKMTVKW